MATRTASRTAKAPARRAAKAPAGRDRAAASAADLAKVAAFHGMAEGDAADLLAAMVERRATPSESLFREKDPGEGLYVILEGSVAIHRANAKGGDREVATLEAGEVFGEMDLISDRPHTSGARAKTECRLLFLPRERFRALLDGGHRGAASLVLYFARMLAGRLDAMNRRMLEVLDGAKGPERTSEFSEFKRRLLKEWVF